MPSFYTTPQFRRDGVVAGFVLRRAFTTSMVTVVQDGVGPDGEPVSEAVEVETIVPSLTPVITKGVLFAQGTMYRPGAAPAVPAIPASVRRFLYYNSGTGFYWSSSATPTTAGDAYVGWAKSDGAGVIATSSRRIGSGPDATLPVPAPVAVTPDNPSAPNIASASGPFVGDFAQGTVPYFELSGTITLPTGASNYGRLQRIVVRLRVSGISSSLVEVARIERAAFGATTVDYHTQLQPRDNLTKSYDVVFECQNEAGTPTASPFTQTVSVPGAAAGLTPGGSIQVQSVTATELAGSRTANDVGSPRFTVRIFPVFPSGTTSATVTVWLSSDNGATWTWIGWYSTTGTGPTIDVPDQVVPNATGTWKAAVQAGAIQRTTSVAGALISSGFSVSGIGTAAANEITSISFLNYPSTGSPLKYGINAYGVPTWGWYALQMTLPSIATDPYFWFARFTVQKGKVVAGVFTAAPDAEGIERQFGDSGVVTGGLAGQGQTITFYGPGAVNAWMLPPGQNPDGTTNDYRVYRFRVYAVTRKNNGTDTLGTGWPSAADHFDLTPAVQSPTLDLGQANPNTGGEGLQVNPNLTQPALVVTGQQFSGLPNFDFEFSPDGQISAADVNWGVGGGTGGTPQLIKSDGGFSGKRYVRLTGASSALQDKIGIQVSAGLPVSFAAWVRSSNTGAPHSLTGYIEWRDKNGTYISAVTIGSITGYQSTWVLGISGIAVAPASATRAYCSFLVDASETAGGYWDVDTVMFQQVVNQQHAGIQQSINPGAGVISGGLSFTSVTTAAGSGYTASRAYMQGTSSELIDLYLDGSGGVGLVLQKTSGGNTNYVGLSAVAGASRVNVMRNNTAYSGVDTTISGHQVVGGVVVS